MQLSKEKFLILDYIENNILSIKAKDFISRQIPNAKEQDEVLSSLPFYLNRKLQINYIAKSIHEKLIDNSNFYKAKDLLKGSPSKTGLLLLPETIYPDFSNVPDHVGVNHMDYPINTIFYSWLGMNEHDEMYGNSYGEEGRIWYGKIHDYVMSFILFYNFTETEIKVIHGMDSGEQRRVKLNQEKFINSSKNNIEIIDLTYFTKTIRAGEFGVKGHFRVQRHGKGNSETKIIFIEEYKKNGYTRNAKIQNN